MSLVKNTNAESLPNKEQFPDEITTWRELRVVDEAGVRSGLKMRGCRDDSPLGWAQAVRTITCPEKYSFISRRR